MTTLEKPKASASALASASVSPNATVITLKTALAENQREKVWIRSFEHGPTLEAAVLSASRELGADPNDRTVKNYIAAKRALADQVNAQGVLAIAKGTIEARAVARTKPALILALKDFGAQQSAQLASVVLSHRQACLAAGLPEGELTSGAILLLKSNTKKASRLVEMLGDLREPEYQTLQSGIAFLKENKQLPAS